ncbi:LysR family transcriptional regulator [Actinoplanes sp. NPDC051411]|uniref:LysR family transcriptional regulator n=1 Tax=Actinoplanes sp. NPDC051411 TaxID=3155522 RepID=UPI003419972E
MTPTQLRAYSAVVRLGSVKQAAHELAVSESAVSLNIGQLRKELGDQLFSRTAAGLAFTPGGLRLASRAAEMLGLQDITVLEVSAAGRGRRMLRVGASSLFAEHGAPGLIELFASRADDLDVELSVRNPAAFETLLLTRAIDIAIGPLPTVVSEDAVLARPMMNYRLVLVAAPDHPLAGPRPTLVPSPRKPLAAPASPPLPASAGRLREQTWLLGPSAAASSEAVQALLHRLAIPEDHQQIFQSHAAALEEAKRGKGVAPAPTFAVAPDVRAGRLVQLAGPQATVEAVWHALTLAEKGAPSAASELARFASTPRAIQAMMRGTGVNVGHFKPSVHVTLWS